MHKYKVVLLVFSVLYQNLFGFCWAPFCHMLTCATFLFSLKSLSPFVCFSSFSNIRYQWSVEYNISQVLEEFIQFIASNWNSICMCIPSIYAIITTLYLYSYISDQYIWYSISEKNIMCEVKLPWERCMMFWNSS